MVVKLAKQFYRENDKAKQKDQQAETIDAMHILHKIRFGPVRIRLPYIKVFRYLL
jgi:hypothetical protein